MGKQLAAGVLALALLAPAAAHAGQASCSKARTVTAFALRSTAEAMDGRLRLSECRRDRGRRRLTVRIVGPGADLYARAWVWRVPGGYLMRLRLDS